MELRNLITFCKIAHLKSYSKAAKELGYAQSTITTQIQLLEQELNIKLFERIGRRMKLTYKGLIFLKYAQNIVNLVDEAKEAVNDIDIPSGTLRIGTVESLCTMKLPKLLRDYHKKYPNVEIIVKLGICSDLRNMLKNNIVDLIFILDEPITDSNLISCISYDEPMAILASPLNRLSYKNNLTIEDIKAEPLILTERGCSYRNAFERIFHKLGLNPHLSLEVGNIEAIKNFTMSNLGITLLPIMAVKEELNKKDLIALDLKGCEFNMMTQLIYHKNKWITAAIKAFIQMASTAPVASEFLK